MRAPDLRPRQARGRRRGVLERRRLPLRPAPASSSRSPSRSSTRSTRPGTAQYAHTLAVGGDEQRLPPARVRPRGRLRGPGAARGRVRALPRGRRALPARATSRTGAAGRRRSSTSPPTSCASAATRHCTWIPIHLGGQLIRQHLELATAEPGGGHAPPRHLLHRGPRAPRPVHGRPARGRPHDRRTRCGRARPRAPPRVLRGPDQDRPRRAGVAHLPADPLDDALAPRPRSTRSRR